MSGEVAQRRPPPKKNTKKPTDRKDGFHVFRSQTLVADVQQMGGQPAVEVARGVVEIECAGEDDDGRTRLRPSMEMRLTVLLNSCVPLEKRASGLVCGSVVCPPK